MQRSMAVSLLLTACFALLLSAFPYFPDMEAHATASSGIYLLEESGAWTALDFQISKQQFSKALKLPFPIQYRVQIFGDLPSSLTGGAPIHLTLQTYYGEYRGRYLLKRVDWEVRDQATRQLLEGVGQVYYGCSDLVYTQQGETISDDVIETGFTYYALPGDDFLIGSTLYLTLPRPDGTELVVKMVNDI
ncbi:MAG: hypothetical protein E7458_08345 [Ruminococcaceae bacterium]|nr:hypothetical protein [Oscillospiraceae bacterium]